MTAGDENHVTDQDEFDPQAEPLGRLIASAMPLSLGDIDVDQVAHVLSDADRLALASLGTSEQLVDRVLANLAAHKNTEQKTIMDSHVSAPSDVETLAKSDHSTITMSDSHRASLGSDSIHPFNELLDSQVAIEQSQELTCKTSYSIQRELGRGAQGVVFLVESIDDFEGHPNIQAIKVFSPKLYETAARYREEMWRLLRVSSKIHAIHHDNLVGIERFIERQGIYVMVMQWIDGWDLRRLLDRESVNRLREIVSGDRWEDLNSVVFGKSWSGHPCLQPAIAVNIIAKCLRALEVLHGQGIVHGDIKPSNIMVDVYGSVRLIDIGSAFELANPPTHRTWTPRYAPPEFLQDNNSWTPQSDLASLGYVLVELLTGQSMESQAATVDQLTWTADRVRDKPLLKEKLALPGQLYDLLPAKARESEHLVKLCQRLINPDPAARFPSANSALVGPEGTYTFRDELARGQLSVSEVDQMKHWLTDVKVINS